MNIIYLHGFASSPTSKKAAYFQERLAEAHVAAHIPNLNVPDFEHLTLTAILSRVAQAVDASPPGPVGLIGSSLGGLAALHFVDRYRLNQGRRIEKLFLMAPALDFRENRLRQMGEDGLSQWQEQGWREFYNYAAQSPRRVHYGLYEDLLQYDSFALQIDQPTLIFHGVRDESVDFNQSVSFAEDRPNVELRLVDSNHELLDQLDVMWAAAKTFFGI